eukprot:m.38423 g.38423  ORF g.38423 m.38423 type:complete len:376 (+) comp10200_c1_seq1:35-1162(+)
MSPVTMKLTCSLAVLVLVCASASAKTLWHQLDNYNFEMFKAEFGKTYATASEHEYRRSVFETNLALIRNHNRDGSKAWKQGVNHMTDWTVEEFRTMLGYDKSMGAMFHKPTSSDYQSGVDLSALPKNVDWREKGIVTAVKDQGQCGSCWTFASAETLESQIAKRTGILQVLSEQNILDCTPNPQQCGGTGGCEGGTAELAYTQMKKNGGLTTEWIYPYKSHDGKDFPTCQFDPSTSVVNVTGYTKIPSNQYEPLMEAVANEGPIAISVEAITWQHYESGIFNGCNQTNPDIDHVVSLVGYGEDNGKQYWLVRNSWTPQWGELGYIRLYRDENQGKECGVDINPQDGSGCTGGPPTVTACGTCGILYDNCYPTIQV